MGGALRLLAAVAALVGLWPRSAAAQQNEEADGSFTLDVTGAVEMQFLFSKAAFRNLFLVVQPTVGATCSVGSSTLNGCLFDTGGCETCADCNLPSDCSCSCLFNQTQSLGNFPAGTRFEAQLQVDEGRDGTIDQVWYANPASNSDGADHLHTFKVTDGQWILQWEDKASPISDFDFNDLVAMIRVRPATVPPVAVSVNNLSVSYMTNVMIEDLGVPDRKIRVTAVVLNATPNPVTFAVCPMLNYSSLSSTDEPVVVYGDIGSTGAPTGCLHATDDEPNFRFSRDQRTDNACPHPGPVVGDKVTVAGASAGAAGEIAIEWEYPIAALDEAVSPANRLGGLTATQIRDRFNAVDSAHFYTDFLYNISIPQVRCPSGPLVLFDASSTPFAAATFTWSLPTSTSINSPVTISVPTTNGTLMDDTKPPVPAVLDFAWTDSLPVHLTGHIHPSVAPRTTFLAGNSGQRYVPVTLDFPDTLPEGFRGRLDVVMRDPSGATVYVIATQHFAKDHSPPTVGEVRTTRTDTTLDVSATVADPPTGIAQVRLDPKVNYAARRPEYLRWVSGDFHDATRMKSPELAALSAADRVSLDLSATDGNHHEVTVLVLPVANTGGDRSIECRSKHATHVFLDGSRSSAQPGSSFDWTGPFGTASGVKTTVPLELGANEVTLTVTDSRGFVGTQTSTLSIVDREAPRLDQRRPLCFDRPRRGFVVLRANRDLAPLVEDKCDAQPDVVIRGVEERHGRHERPDDDAVVFDDRVCLPAKHHDERLELEVTLRDHSGNERHADIDVDEHISHGCDAIRHLEVVDEHDPICAHPAPLADRRVADNRVEDTIEPPPATDELGSPAGAGCTLGGRPRRFALWWSPAVLALAVGLRRRRERARHPHVPPHN
jgi:hypothetical protein